MKNNIENIAHPICPLNLWFEGDERKIDLNKCDFRNRGCSVACTKIKEGDWWYNEDLLEKIIHNQTCKEMGFSFSKYKHLSIRNAEGLFVAYCGCHDKTLTHVLQILKCVNDWDDLQNACKDLIAQAKCMLQSHQCSDHPNGICSDRTNMQDSIKDAETIINADENTND